MESATHSRTIGLSGPRARLRSLRLPPPELLALLVLAAVLDLWALGQNGWANQYYSAAVRSMSGSWHNFLFGSMDPSGLMTVDKPPLAFWVQALSVKAFGYSSLSILVPQALMGIASVGLLYDLTRRRWGRGAGAVAGLLLALTPIAVAISRHNNPDALLVLCCVAALWAFVRALEHGGSRWLVLAGVFIGLGFETKMGVALMIVPGMALAWLWVAPRGRRAAIGQLLGAGAAMAVVGLAWPLLVELTPAANRPWISGTSDNRILSLILEYNGLGRLDGQAGGPQAFGGGGPFGGQTGPLRLLNESLGGQAGWLLGLSLVGGIGIAMLSRLRRADPRTGWILAVGGAFATIALTFSFASGIFHPYYVSLLAPFAAALAGATFGQAREGSSATRLLAAVALAAGAVTELVVFTTSAGELDWLIPIVIVLVVAVVAGLGLDPSPARRRAALTAGLGVLLIAPAIWSLQTLGHPTSGTFPAGGPESETIGGFGGPGGFGGQGGPSGQRFAPAGLSGKLPGSAAPFGGTTPPARLSESAGPGANPGSSTAAGGPPLPGSTGIGGQAGPAGSLPSESAAGTLPLPAPGSGVMAGSPGGFGGSVKAGGVLGLSGALGAGPAAAGGPPGAGGQSLTKVVAYTRSHGGGTIAVPSQSSAAAAIVDEDADVAGIGGFSGKESTVSPSWLREAIDSGRIRWILAEPTTGGGRAGGGPGPGGDTRPGSQAAIAAVTSSCERVRSATLTASETLYDCSAAG